ncbi:hypothetical protein ZOSMA_80G00230 [Zostera marina]|uniref:Uncharacterized protein n=1 Tax=Zostera marina TaxID=29655 RepID=A0A0K9NME5_ZOSMR|nr:hypothetical protein ZOSMA_80G00230 [Zostera marina]
MDCRHNNGKLWCVNWAAHMPVVLAEGLDRRPLPEIVDLIANLGFNCVRLTWAMHMFTVPRYVSLTVRRRKWLLRRHLLQPRRMAPRVRFHHASFLYFPSSGGDEHEERASRAVTNTYASWYNHVTLGACTINAVNPDVLIIVSGLNFDTDLSFLLPCPLPIHSLKLVYEAHWYAFSEGKREEWESPTHSPFHVCSAVAERFHHRAGFMTPLFVSEFGMDQRGLNRADNHFMTCFLGSVAERDVDYENAYKSLKIRFF